MSGIEARADFSGVRYAQAWEDADVLCAAMGDVAGRPLLAVCASGDNALALLTLDPAKVVAADLSQAQLACLRLRIEAMRALSHGEYLELLGAAASNRRALLFDRVRARLSAEDQSFWTAQAAPAVALGVAAIGKFERYFAIFRRFLLPLVHSRRAIEETFAAKSREARAAFYAASWDTWRWRLLLAVFFSNWTMGRLGRDPAFFDHVEGSLADHVARKVAYAGVELDPSQNPFMSWILRGHPGRRLPLPWRAEHYETIRARLDRVETVESDIVAAAEREAFAGFYLSDVFEYMSAPDFEAAYARLVATAAPGARLVYWNMMVPRSAPAAMAARVRTLDALAQSLAREDKAFFYSGFHIDEVV